MEEKIGLFPELSPEERREVEEYVEKHPHLREAFEGMLRLDRALREGRALRDDPPDDEALAFVAVMHDVDATRMPATLRAAVRKIERRIETEENLRTSYEALLRRRADLEAGSDMNAQLRRLMGRRSAPERPRETTTGRRPEAGANQDASGAGRRPIRRLVTAAVALAAVYAMLFVGGRVVRPETERLARFDRSELVLEGYENVRGSATEGDLSATARRYLEALTHLRQAETDVLGLFPGYDASHLDAAATRLREVMEAEPDESFLAHEAEFLLGKTELARGNAPEARSILERVSASGGRRADSAERLLRALEE